ncbi:MAG: hypothetical protein MJ252_28540 [archaeon]|nr:hypothetical protein [archaeon]
MIFTAIVVAFCPSIYFSNKLKPMKKDGDKFITDYQREYVSVFEVRKSKPEEREPNYCRKYSAVLFNVMYWLIVLSRAGINVIFTVFRFFMPKYICDALNGNESNKTVRTHVYAFVIFTCPYFGSKLGWIFTKAVGGYNKKKAFLVTLLLQFLLAAVCVPLPLWNDWKIFMVNGFIYHVLSSAILPIYKGIIPLSVPKEYGPIAGTIANYFISGLFNGPAPAVYGLMLDHWKEVDTHWSMKCFCSLPIFGVIFMSIACGMRYAQPKDESLIGQQKAPIAKPTFTQKLHEAPNAEVPKEEKKDVEMVEKK